MKINFLITKPTKLQLNITYNNEFRYFLTLVRKQLLIYSILFHV